MCSFDRAMNTLDENYAFLASNKQIVSCANDEEKVCILLRQKLLHMYINILEKRLLRSLKSVCVCVCVNKHNISTWQISSIADRIGSLHYFWPKGYLVNFFADVNNCDYIM